MTEYAPLTVDRFHKYLIANNIRLRLSDMEEILRKADEEMGSDIRKGNLQEKSEPVLYQYAYEPALKKLAEVNEARIKYATQHGPWNGIDRRRHHHPTDN